MSMAVFQSAPPVKGATFRFWFLARFFNVSIRAPREGGDVCRLPWQCKTACFNPRPP